MKLILKCLAISTLAMAALGADIKLTMPAGKYSIQETAAHIPQFQLMNDAAKKCAFGIDVGCEIANVKNLRSGYVYHAWSAKKPILRMITVALGAPEKTAE